MKTVIDERFLVSPYFAFFLIYSNIVGIGIMNFQREIAKDAGYDAWISVILTGLSIHLLLWMMYRILKIANDDVMYINRYCFKKWIGGFFNICFILYFFVLALIVFRVYIEVVQVWMFPLMKTWQISFIFLILLYYIVSGGFRVITGICFWGTIIPFMILTPISSFALEFAEINHLLPIFNHSLAEIVGSSRSMVFQFLGVETLFMFYPFLKNPEKSQKWAHFGLLFTIMLYLYVTILTFLYFSEPYLKHTIWPSLTLMKIAEIPIIERFEYITVSFWFLLVLPNISVKLWAACRGVKKLINIRQRTILFIFLLLFLLFANLLEDVRQIERIQDICSKIGFSLLYVYIPFLFLVIQVKHKMTKYLDKS